MLQIKARCIYCGGEMRFGMKTHYECGGDMPKVRYFYECAECGARTMSTDGRKKAQAVAKMTWDCAGKSPIVIDVSEKE